MRIKAAELIHVRLPMKFVFQTAKAALPIRETLIIKLTDESGCCGYGECAAFTEPFYTRETLARSKQKLLWGYIPDLLDKEITHPFDIHKWNWRYPMAAAGIEAALLDLYARSREENMVSLIFHEELRPEVELGMVLGDLPYEELAMEVGRWEIAGCRRFKIKIKPQDGFERMERLVKEFPQISFLADANRSFQLSQIEEVKKLDNLGLLCIEEPFSFRNIEECRGLQTYIKTPICLDESVQTMGELERAYRLDAFRMLNVKVGRLGGLYYAKKMIEFCREKNLEYWIGSMVESGISKIMHIQLAGLSDTAMPGDLSDSNRYFTEDLIIPGISFKQGRMKIPRSPGLGVEIDQDVLKKYAVEAWIRSVQDYELN